jgi:4-amino-4-deoxychorismate lyase
MILINGAVSSTLAVIDRGLAYGDGVFRTFVMRGGRPHAWHRHFRKLEHDCAALAIRCPTKVQMTHELALLAEREPDCTVKIVITRGPGQRGYALPAPVEPTRIVMSFPLPQYPEERAQSGITARICSLRLGLQPALAGIKHLNRLENVLARAEWDDPNIAEGLLLDSEGNTIGGTMTNLFIVENGALATPELNRCGVAGVTRERIFAHAAEHGIVCRVEPIAFERVLQADEAFVVNSLIGVWQIRTLARKAWMPGLLTGRVRQWLDEESD